MLKNLFNDRPIKNKKMKKNGSVLVYAMVLLSLILAMAIGLVSVSLTQSRSTLTTTKSTEAFQIADSAAEKYLELVYDDTSPATKPSDFDDCSNDKIEGSFDDERKYQILFYDSDGNQLDCNDSDSIGTMKSIGFYGGTVRAIEITIGTN